MSLSHALDWKTWFEPDRFLDVFTIPLSIAIAAIVVHFSKTQLFQILLNKTTNEDKPIIQLKELSGLKIYSLWNLFLAIGLIFNGLLYKGFNRDSIEFTAYVSFYGASLGWAYAFGYFVQAWPKQEKILKRILFTFLCVAVLEKLLGLYSHSKIEIKQLFFYTIPSLILLLNAAFQKDKNKFTQKFWLSSLIFNLALIGIFCIDSLKDVGRNKVSIIKLCLAVAPIVATYMSLIFYKKSCGLKNDKKPSRIVQLLALLSLAGGAVLLSQGISKVSQYMVDEITKYEQESTNNNPQSAINSQQNP